MTLPAEPVGELPRRLPTEERRLGGTVLRTYRTKIDLRHIVPNERQPRLGNKVDEELQRQIEANEGLFEPLLLEPHPDQPDKLRIIDGERRWTNSRELVQQGREQYRLLPVEVIDRTLSEDERLRVWIYIHRQRKEWDAREKEMVAYRLVDLSGRVGAANILGISMRELDKLVETFELSTRFTNLRGAGAAITWARELIGVNKALRTPAVIDAVVKKVSEKRITNSKDLRRLRTVLRDPVARDHFLKDEGDIDSAALRVAVPTHAPGQTGLLGDLGALAESIKKYSWTDLEALRGDENAVKQVQETARLLETLKQALSRPTSSRKDK